MQDDALAAWRRRSMLVLAGSAAVAPCLAATGNASGGSGLLALAHELGLTGMGARGLIRRVGDALGPQQMERQRLALMQRMDACGCAMDEMADLVRMWARDDFSQDRTTTVGGLRFADTEIAVFALVGNG
ncbi:hypothetical protein ASF44_05160 [Pseudorhodoferax sp. Leaf274]|nr:hypothetical protein ASF44_05160 [Pseudorhodoferax sp. Leaf274]